MCFRVDVTYKCGHTETLLRPYSATGYPKCRMVQEGETRPGHIDTTDMKGGRLFPEKDRINDCMQCSFISGERWTSLSSIGCSKDAEIIMMDAYLRTESFKTMNEAIHSWVLEPVDMDSLRATGGAEFEFDAKAMGAAARRLDLDRENAIEELALREIGYETRTDENWNELDERITEIKYDREEGPGSEYRFPQYGDKRIIQGAYDI